jgi:hypothetical protein
MAGRGPQPKAVEKRARTNKDPIPMRVLPRLLASQPDLPDPIVWPDQTRVWWQMWADSALSVDFTATDWSELLDAALLHAQVWQGELKWLPELRLRTAKFGATPEDRARLRIQFAAADEAEGIKRVPRSARERFGSVPSDMPALEA